MNAVHPLGKEPKAGLSTLFVWVPLHHGTFTPARSLVVVVSVAWLPSQWIMGCCFPHCPSGRWLPLRSKALALGPHPSPAHASDSPVVPSLSGKEQLAPFAEAPCLFLRPLLFYAYNFFQEQEAKRISLEQQQQPKDLQMKQFPDKEWGQCSEYRSVLTGLQPQPGWRNAPCFGRRN